MVGIRRDPAWNVTAVIGADNSLLSSLLSMRFSLLCRTNGGFCCIDIRRRAGGGRWRESPVALLVLPCNQADYQCWCMRASRGVLRARLRRGRWPLPTPQDAGPRLDPPLLPNLLLPFLQHTLLPNRPPLATYSYRGGIHVWCYCASFICISNRDGVLPISFHAENGEWLPS